MQKKGGYNIEQFAAEYSFCNFIRLSAVGYVCSSVSFSLHPISLLLNEVAGLNFQGGSYFRFFTIKLIVLLLFPYSYVYPRIIPQETNTFRSYIVCRTLY